MATPKVLLTLMMLLLATLVAAQSEAASLPLCALTCLNKLLPLSTCAPTDQTCLCTNIDFQNQLGNCVRATCTVKEGLTTEKISAASCGVPYRDRSHELRYTSIPFITITTIFVIARVVARLPYFGSKLGLDDAVIVLSWMLAVGLTVVTLLSSEIGLGRDIWTVPFNDITRILMYITINGVIYFTAVWLTKISILLQYLRLFPDEAFRMRVKIGLALCSAAAFCMFWTWLFKCHPVSYNWTSWDGEHQGTCLNFVAQAWTVYVLNTVGDLAVLLLPIPSIWRLNLPFKKKLRVMFMFSVGLFVTIITLVRLGSIKHFSTSTNVTWDFIGLTIWSSIEVYVGIICACLPGMQNFTTRVFYGKVLRSMGLPDESTGARTPEDSARPRRKVRVKNDTSLMATDLSSMTDSMSKEREPSKSGHSVESVV